MCYGCWEEYGKPAIINDATKHAADLIKWVYEFSPVGGNAHIVLDDFNIEDHSIDWCLDTGVRENICGASPTQLCAEEACLRKLKSMTVPERASALALFDGWIEKE